MKGEPVVLVVGLLILVGGLFGAIFPDLAIKMNKAFVPDASYRLVEKFVVLTPGVVRAWNSLGVIIGIIVILCYFFVD